MDFVRVQVACWDCMVGEGGARPEGLLGRTWDREAAFTAREADEVVERYRERDGDVWGCNTLDDKHCNEGQKQSLSS